jgi:hypothetical protein
MSYSGRTSEEILKELLSVLAEYQETTQEEREIERQRLNYLETELQRQREKNRQLAAILTRD